MNNVIEDSDIATNCHCGKLRAASRTITKVYDDALRPVGIKANQLTILVATSLIGPVSITDLAKAISTERTTLVRNLKLIENEDLILIEQKSGRTKWVSITTKGKKTIAKAKPLWKEAQAHVHKAMGMDKMKKLNNTLNEISRALD